MNLNQTLIDELSTALVNERTEHARTRAKLKEAESGAAHWKANHDAQVERARIVIERPDVPFERVRAYHAMGECQEDLRRAGAAAGVANTPELARDLVRRIWLFRELLWNANRWAANYGERLPFQELIAEHAGLSTDAQP